MARSWKIPVICVPSASQGFGGNHKPPAAFNLFSIAKTNAGWSCQMVERGIVDEQMTIRTIREQDLTVGAVFSLWALKERCKVIPKQEQERTGTCQRANQKPVKRSSVTESTRGADRSSSGT